MTHPGKTRQNSTNQRSCAVLATKMGSSRSFRPVGPCLSSRRPSSSASVMPNLSLNRPRYGRAAWPGGGRADTAKKNILPSCCVMPNQSESRLTFSIIRPIIVSCKPSLILSANPKMLVYIAPKRHSDQEQSG